MILTLGLAGFCIAAGATEQFSAEARSLPAEARSAAGADGLSAAAREKSEPATSDWSAAYTRNESQNYIMLIKGICNFLGIRFEHIKNEKLSMKMIFFSNIFIIRKLFRL